MSQIALPLAKSTSTMRIATGVDNAHVIDALATSAQWPFGTAMLSGPPRSGKTVLAQWFAQSHGGDMLDDADRLDETALFHRWNRAQEQRIPLLVVVQPDWQITLPDLASRMGAALHLEIGAPDDQVLAELITLHAEQRGFVLGADAAAYLLPRCERSHAGIERLVATIDRLSLERKQPPTMALWRDALEHINGAQQPRLL